MASAMTMTSTPTASENQALNHRHYALRKRCTSAHNCFFSCHGHNGFFQQQQQKQHKHQREQRQPQQQADKENSSTHYRGIATVKMGKASILSSSSPLMISSTMKMTAQSLGGKGLSALRLEPKQQGRPPFTSKIKAVSTQSRASSSSSFPLPLPQLFDSAGESSDCVLVATPTGLPKALVPCLLPSLPDVPPVLPSTSSDVNIAAIEWIAPRVPKTADLTKSTIFGHKALSPVSNPRRGPSGSPSRPPPVYKKNTESMTAAVSPTVSPSAMRPRALFQELISPRDDDNHEDEVDANNSIVTSKEDIPPPIVRLSKKNEEPTVLQGLDTTLVVMETPVQRRFGSAPLCTKTNKKSLGWLVERFPSFEDEEISTQPIEAASPLSSMETAATTTTTTTSPFKMTALPLPSGISKLRMRTRRGPPMAFRMRNLNGSGMPANNMSLTSSKMSMPVPFL